MFRGQFVTELAPSLLPRAVGSLLFNRTSPQCRFPKWKLVNNDLSRSVTFMPMRGIHFREGAVPNWASSLFSLCLFRRHVFRSADECAGLRHDGKISGARDAKIHHAGAGRSRPA
jgi:hypothetical protein